MCPPGLAQIHTFVHAGGTIHHVDLGPGETLRVDTGCLVALQPSVNYDIQFVGKIKTALFGGEGIFFATLVIAKEEGTYQGSIPLVTFGALTAAIIAVFTIASGAIILIPTWLWSLGLISYIDPLLYKVVWWGMGHSSQQINVSAHVAIWYMVGALLLGAIQAGHHVLQLTL